MTEYQYSYNSKIPVSDSPETAVLLDGCCCLVCYEDLVWEIAVSYQAKENGVWSISRFCIDCVKQLIARQFIRYIRSVENSTCAREQRALLDRGPPINVSDRIGFPLADTEEVYMLYECGTGQYMSPKLVGSPVGEERQQLWDELRKFRIQNDVEE